MKFLEFLNLVDRTYHLFNWRYGQSLMNVLYSVSPSKYDNLVAAGEDCYYDDSKVHQVISKLENEWKN
jgi:hypothetical protein